MKPSSKFLTSTVAILLSLAVVLFAAGLFINAFRAPADKVTVTSQTVLERITDQYFVVTKTAFIDQETSIVVDKKSKVKKAVIMPYAEYQKLLRNQKKSPTTQGAFDEFVGTLSDSFDTDDLRYKKILK